MTSIFGFLSRLEFLQNAASNVLVKIDPAVIHNLEKYHTLNKVHYLSAIEQIEGDYLEFGVFTGSSFCHSIRCVRQLTRYSSKLQTTRFFGFDSFAGFGKLDESEMHPFYTDENFATTLQVVERRVRKVARNLSVTLVPGFFEQSLRPGAAAFGITSARIIFVDSDTYSSARDALTFCRPIIHEGTFVVLDDYFSYRGSIERGVAAAFNEFLESGQFVARHVFTYGMGGAVFVISKVLV